jgi:hypothetical protein
MEVEQQLHSPGDAGVERRHRYGTRGHEPQVVGHRGSAGHRREQVAEQQQPDHRLRD